MNIVFIVLTFAGLLLPVVAPFNRRAGRRVFWSGFLVAFASAFFITYPPDWKTGIVLSLMAGGGLLLTAYFTGPHIKIGGKIYAFHVEDSLPDPSPDGAPPPGSADPDYDPAPDSYGGTVTAKKFWWLLIFSMAMCVGCVVMRDDDKPWWLGPSAAAILVVGAAVFGHNDASWGYPIARGQRLQLGIISVITFGVFTVVYLGAYRAGKRWPLRRTQDMEYRAHPRHQKRHS